MLTAPETTTQPSFEPVAVERCYPPPAATVHPDPRRGWIRRLLPLVLTHRWLVAVSIGLAVASMLIQVALPAVIRSAIDDGLTARTVGVERYAVALVGLGVLRAICIFGFRGGLFRVAYAIDTDLRVLLFEHLGRLSFAYYDRTQSGQLISRANSDIRAVQRFGVFAPILAASGVMLVAAVGYMLSIHVWLTVAALAPLPAVFVLGRRLRNEMFPLSWITQARMADVATRVDENVNGVRVIRSFAAEEAEIGELASAAVRLRWSGLRTIDARAGYNPWIENLPRVGTLVVLVYGGVLVIDGRITEGTLFAFASYVLLLQVPFRTLGLLLMFGQRARASAARIFEVLDTVPDLVDRPDAADLTDPVGAIRFDGVSFAYPSGTAAGSAGSAGSEGSHRSVDSESPPGANGVGGRVLDGFTLDIAPGETVAIVGRTGSGKSTVARLLARFYDVDSGSVTIDGHDVRDLSQASVRAAVGVVSDEPFLFSASLADNIAYARPGADRAAIEMAARAAQAHAFISALPEGYDTVVGERGYTLSGGQRQRIALARALLAGNRILVLDDATSAVDAEVEQRIHDAIGAGPDRRTTILIAHRLSTIAQADRVVLLADGRVEAEGRHAELMATEPRYAAILADLETRDGTGDGDERPGAAGDGHGGDGPDGDGRASDGGADGRSSRGDDHRSEIDDPLIWDDPVGGIDR